MIRHAWTALAIVAAVAALACNTPTPAPPAPDVAADKAKLETDAASWFDLLAKGDTNGMANLYAEDALLMPPGAQALNGRADIAS
jgi:hypothetical protein